ncbi:hypothetical protein [Streptomyces sp. NPDC051577]|uniref:hypothetical protein n=1 Tax=Streptomyces sp. NPDC051577 TaxID=3155166 RepID=UPI00342E15F4
MEVGYGLPAMMDMTGGREDEVSGEVAERTENHGGGQVADAVDFALAGGDREEADDGDLRALLSEAPDPPGEEAEHPRGHGRDDGLDGEYQVVPLAPGTPCGTP